MAVFNRFRKDLILPYSNENAAASFYGWIRDLFDHPDGYSVVYDQELLTPSNRQNLPLPSIVVNQIDTSEPGRGFMGTEADQNSCLFYLYCLVAKGDERFGSIRLLRRMKDQLVFALKRAGMLDESSGDVIVPPMIMRNYAHKPPTELDSTLVLNGGIQQHLTEEGDILQYELLVSLRYMVSNKLQGA